MVKDAEKLKKKYKEISEVLPNDPGMRDEPTLEEIKKYTKGKPFGPKKKGTWSFDKE